MEGLFNLAWLVPVPTFLAFLAIVLFVGSNKTVSALTAIGGAAVAFALSWPIAFTAFGIEHFGEHPFANQLFAIPTGTRELFIGYQIDPSNALLLFMVSFLLVMIFVYASGYMTFPPHLNPEQYPRSARQGKDPRYSRFMAYISLFATGMLGLVISDSLLMLFIFWEIMGLCSYLLIGFWYEKETARAASIKAFMTTRVGDAIMLIGMILLYIHSEPSSLSFSVILNAENLAQIAAKTFALPGLGLELPLLGLIAILIFFGTVGKSAQFPLHVWLPDAMEGPTPVSAMIHAATMVSAGVFLLIRLFPIFYVAGETTPGVMAFVAFTGAFTAIFASTIAVAQWDIKRVLAYSTISQLGFMVAAIGIGGYVAALFHLLTHAFFKALLFLGSGSVIHGVEHGLHEAHGHGHDDTVEDHHEPAHQAGAPGESHVTTHVIERPDGNLDPEDPQDMRNMGGLLSRMPRTAWTFIIGGLSLAGFPLITAGFWSKDEILAKAWYLENFWVFGTLAVAAFLTAFYTARQIGLTFLGAPRTEMAEHAPESVGSMTWPLILISPFAIALGWIGIPNNFPLLGAITPFWIDEQLEPYAEYLEFTLSHPSWSWIPLLTSFIVALGGLFLGYVMYKDFKVGQIDPLQKALGPLWTLLHNKYYVDEFYQNTVVVLTKATGRFLALFDDVWVIDPIVDGIGWISVQIGRGAAAFDRIIVDGLVNGSGNLSNRLGGILRNTQDGHVQAYLMVVVVVFVTWLLLQAMPILMTLV